MFATPAPLPARLSLLAVRVLVSLAPGAHHDADVVARDRAVGDRGGPVVLDRDAGEEADNSDIGGRERATFVRDAGSREQAAVDCEARHRDGGPARDRDLVAAGKKVGRGLDRGDSGPRTDEGQTLWRC